ncbi:MAG: hypothetical protein A3G32_04515 [Deltaproteobacteria bacterium RIFCSPLOWO2_12_FULL_40_28]|nr:MAG: hypothetical protein A3C45_08625 [Deltaproteobacteria bacterium RIFCSPHIGHO2_02_FULL_40_28]OGQ19634.1 MAG: hypothetical protein A3E27_07820 [Deltaproteobacteria bacterium RIFCSPHIGHO2_12_FULL_40_32]OGQ40911.1 MAG: hypothetical protein A3I69_03235 [Deltaproteobacteria bacterium RIFCSPLOWO2_02_FULL_40_36]OGQ54026.1 MAG: hypothetical protein A3G32_04515 [Deltaproteobacteria bacterium RIFCSPLOWO2_12_FULL_40_28]
MIQWYVIKTKPFREDHVSKIFQNAGFETFNPKLKEVNYRGTLKTYSIKPFFPTYLFLQIDFDRGELIHLVKYTRGVSKILCAENKPLALKSQIIKLLKSTCNENGVVEKKVPFLAGSPVRVRKGILKDLIGIIEKPIPSEERIIVLLKLLNYNMKASLHWTEVELIRAA